MRASVRRIDLTTEPVGVELWPTLNWLAHESSMGLAPEAQVAAPQAHPAGPQGRTGLWSAMAHAVQRVREVSLATADDDLSRSATGAQVFEFGPDAPHLAYLARVACSSPPADEPTSLPGADVIALADQRARGTR